MLASNVFKTSLCWTPVALAPQEGKPRRPVGGAYGCFLAAKRSEIAKNLPEGHKMTDVGKAQGFRAPGVQLGVQGSSCFSHALQGGEEMAQRTVDRIKMLMER